jgi:hypothetical protein
VIVQAELPPYLSEIRDAACWRCAEELLGEECETRLSVPQLLQSLRAGQKGQVADYLKRKKGRVCGQCALMLLIHAVNANIPAEELPDWLDRPDYDLDGRTPRQCIQAENYEPVFEALWLRTLPGPVS